MKMVILRVQMIAESFKMPTNCEILVPAGCERDNGRIAPGFWRQPRRWPGFLPSPHFPHPSTFFKTKIIFVGRSCFNPPQKPLNLI